MQTAANDAPRWVSQLMAKGIPPDNPFDVQTIVVRWHITEICENGHEVYRWEFPKRDPA